MDGNEKVRLFVVSDLGALLERNEYVIAACIENFGSEALAHQGPESLSNIQNQDLSPSGHPDRWFLYHVHRAQHRSRPCESSSRRRVPRNDFRRAAREQRYPQRRASQYGLAPASRPAVGDRRRLYCDAQCAP